jgi:Cof subfamily protein (haloacid dehalogenase superfamily)
VEGAENLKPYQDFILISDLDGTLANSEHKVSEKNKKAIVYFVEQGGHFSIATGRTQKNVVPYMTDLIINAPCILYNGGALFSWQEQRFIKTMRMKSNDLSDFLRFCILSFPQMCIEVFTEEQLYVVTDPANIDEHMKREKQEFVYAKIDDILDTSWIKIILCDSHEHLLASRNLLAEFYLEDKTNQFFSAVTYLEIVGKHVSKGNMLGELLNMEPYRLKKVIAVGDFENDIEMLRRADYGVAPANAQEDVKKIADRVAVSNDDDVIHDIIYRIVPTLL